ncbi:MAG: cation:proton antiporter [Erythrobacter sp.]|uniref:cation:proton antiporter n=1 Tax=Erythrobacter sp. TaxID=1042 RepID=UPI0032662156
MIEAGLLWAFVAAFIFAMLARRLASSVLTAPIYFIALGLLLAKVGWIELEAAEQTLHLVAEATLVVLLFLDASQIDLRQLKKHHVWPQRMLMLGLPLSVLIGTFVAGLILPDWPLVALALVAAILAPTDAALGQSVVTNEAVPQSVRRGLTVESGLNDGMALPLILLFASLVGEVDGRGTQDWIAFGFAQILLGPLAGIIVGWVGAVIMLRAVRHKLTSASFEGIAALSLAAIAYLAAGEIGGNGFISAFVAGLTFGNCVKGRCKFLFEFAESEGQLFMWAAFFLVGLVLVPEALENLTWPIFGLIMLSLFLVRPLAIWLSLIGTKTAASTKLFMGWFGPRGLATALFALLILPQIGGEYEEIILAIAINAVWISAILHGVSATPLSKLYGNSVSNMGSCAEQEPVPMPFETDSPTISEPKTSDQTGETHD